MSLRVRFGDGRERRAGGLNKLDKLENLDNLNKQAELGEGDEGDLALEQALKNFRMSVVAWSEAAYSRPRTAAQAVWHRSWRLAAGWALGCALAAGGAAGVGYERHHAQEVARIAAARVAEQQKAVREQETRAEEEDLLAKVDSDVSREVPSAMEPLAQLMAEDERQ